MNLHNIPRHSLFAIALLTGCDGGSPTNQATQSHNQPATTTVGIAVDSPIIGMRYLSTNKDNTINKRGITNLKGEFEYFEEGTTEFFVGTIKVGSIKPSKFVSIPAIAETELESGNIARFLQTIDEDNDPDNGIQIPESVDSNATRITLRFGKSFDVDFNNIKPKLFQHTAHIPETVTLEQALDHAEKSIRLSSLKEFDLYKAIANEKNYKNGAYYNSDALKNDQKRRVYLWIWESLISKEMSIEDELKFTQPKFDLENAEKTRNQIQKYLDYANAIIGLASLGEGTFNAITKAGAKTFSYEITTLTSLTIGGCDAVVKIYGSDKIEEITSSSHDLCKNIVNILNPTNEPESKLAAINPILSGFLPTILPRLLHATKMNWVNPNIKSLRTISRLKLANPDVISIALSIASLPTDTYAASWASSINEEITTRMVAREWLSSWFRSGFDQKYMNKLINNNTKELVGMKQQTEAIALKLGSTGAMCDTYEFFNPFYVCTGIENINYNYEKTVDIINDKLYKSNALFRKITALIGPVYNEKGVIGRIEYDWIGNSGLSELNTPAEGVAGSYFHYRDDFNSINREFWNVVRVDRNWESNDLDYSAVTLNNGTIRLYNDRTDDGPIMYSTPIAINNGSTVKIRRKIYIHSSNRHLNGTLSVLSTSNNTLDVNSLNSLCGIQYVNETYPSDWNGFYLYDRNNQSAYMPPIWDDWFEEEFIYNTASGEASYVINGEAVSNKCKIFEDDGYIVFKIHNFGWYTGHYLDMDYIDIEIIPPRNSS